MAERKAATKAFRAKQVQAKAEPKAAAKPRAAARPKGRK
jgi:hypothetical protein